MRAKAWHGTALLLMLVPWPAEAFAATVLSIGDGDTIRLRQAGRPTTVRLACIDAPETAQSPYGQQTCNYLQQRLPIGREVVLEVKTTDRYGRTVAEVFSGVNINLALVEDGQAFAYRQYLRGCNAKEYLDMAALIAREVPEAATGLEAVVTGLTTTSRRDAFRLQISIPIPKASRRLRELGVTSTFAWDFDRTTGTDKLRLVISCTETAFRELQELLAASYDVSKCGYSYYPAHDGRHYPWYLSLTDGSGKAPENPEQVEKLIRSLFGVPSESTRIRERQERLKELEEKQEDINKRLETSRAEERRLRREFDFNKTAWEQRAEKAQQQGEQAIELAQSVEGELSEQLDLKEQELQLALAEKQGLRRSTGAEHQRAGSSEA